MQPSSRTNIYKSAALHALHVDTNNASRSQCALNQETVRVMSTCVRLHHNLHRRQPKSRSSQHTHQPRRVLCFSANDDPCPPPALTQACCSEMTHTAKFQTMPGCRSPPLCDGSEELHDEVCDCRSFLCRIGKLGCAFQSRWLLAVGPQHAPNDSFEPTDGNPTITPPPTTYACTYTYLRCFGTLCGVLQHVTTAISPRSERKTLRHRESQRRQAFRRVRTKLQRCCSATLGRVGGLLQQGRALGIPADATTVTATWLCARARVGLP